MTFPFVIDNNAHRLSSVLNDLLAKTEDRPFDVATAYFAVSGYRLVKDSLHKAGAFRLLLGSEPHTGTDLGLRPDAAAIKARLQGDLEAEPFNEETLRLVEELIAFLPAKKVEVRLFDRGFLHAKADVRWHWLASSRPVSSSGWNRASKRSASRWSWH